MMYYALLSQIRNYVFLGTTLLVFAAKSTRTKSASHIIASLPWPTHSQQGETSSSVARPKVLIYWVAMIETKVIQATEQLLSATLVPHQNCLNFVNLAMIIDVQPTVYLMFVYIHSCYDHYRTLSNSWIKYKHRSTQTDREGWFKTAVFVN